MVIAAQLYFIYQYNSASILRGNIVVNHTIQVWAWTNWPSQAIQGQKLYQEFNTIQYLLIIIQSNHQVHHSQFKNIQKLGLTVDLGITNIIDTALRGCWLSYSIYNILSSWHRLIILAYNATSRTIIIVVPLGAVNTGTINSMLFPLPVGITTTIGLSPCQMACIARSWTPWNYILGCLVIHCAVASRSIVASQQWHSMQLTSASSSYRACLCLPNIDRQPRALNPKN